MPKTKKKVCLFIVEGYSDQAALAVPLTTVFEQYDDSESIQFEITYRDITSEKDNSPRNIASEIGDIVRVFMKKNKLKKEDFIRIVQIVDMDGAYVTPEHVRIDENRQFNRYPRYTENDIFVSDEQKREEMVQRNKRKSANLDRICEMPLIMEIPFSVFYFSCNLDHVLYNEQNLEDEKKVDRAFAFASQYENDASGFMKLLESVYPKDAAKNRKSSWEYIRQEQNSLKRSSNFFLVFGEFKKKYRKYN